MTKSYTYRLIRLSLLISLLSSFIRYLKTRCHSSVGRVLMNIDFESIEEDDSRQETLRISPYGCNEIEVTVAKNLFAQFKLNRYFIELGRLGTTYLKGLPSRPSIGCVMGISVYLLSGSLSISDPSCLYKELQPLYLSFRQSVLCPDHFFR